MTDLAHRLKEYLTAHAYGRGRAVPRHEALAHLWLFDPDLSDRTFRRLYRSCGVCSTAKGEPMGLFLPASRAEVEAFRDELFAKVPAAQALERYRIVLQAFPQFAPPARGEQMELF